MRTIMLVVKCMTGADANLNCAPFQDLVEMLHHAA